MAGTCIRSAPWSGVALRRSFAARGSGKSAGINKLRSPLKAMAISTAFSSWRTLPGQLYSAKCASVSRETARSASPSI